MKFKRTKEFWKKVKDKANEIKADGCTASPELFYHTCCDEHDIAYRTGKDVEGNEVTRSEADNELFRCMRKRGKLGPVGKVVLPVVYWTFVRVFGWYAWKGDRAVLNTPPKPAENNNAPNF